MVWPLLPDWAGMFLKLVSRPQIIWDLPWLNVCRTLLLKQRPIWKDDGGGKMGCIMRGRSWYLDPNLVYVICFKLLLTARGIPPRRWVGHTIMNEQLCRRTGCASMMIILNQVYIWNRKKLHLAERLRHSHPDLVVTEIEHIFGFSDTGRSEGGHYPWWHSYGWQTQIGASGSHYSVLLMGLPLLLYHKSTNCPFSVSTVCHHLSLLC